MDDLDQNILEENLRLIMLCRTGTSDKVFESMVRDCPLQAYKRGLESGQWGLEGEEESCQTKP